MFVSKAMHSDDRNNLKRQEILGNTDIPIPNRQLRVCLCIQLCTTLCDPMTVARQAPCLWNFPSKYTGVGCHFLLQGIFLTQGSNPCLLSRLHWCIGSLLGVPPGRPITLKN